MITSHRLARFALPLLSIFLASCASSEMSKNNLLFDVTSYISDQRAAGTLPGITKDGGILQIDTSESGRITSGQPGGSGAYPIRYVVVANKFGNPLHYPVYRYELCKNSADSGWTIARAVRIDSETASVELK